MDLQQVDLMKFRAEFVGARGALVKMAKNDKSVAHSWKMAQSDKNVAHS